MEQPSADVGGSSPAASRMSSGIPSTESAHMSSDVPSIASAHTSSGIPLTASAHMSPGIPSTASARMSTGKTLTASSRRMSTGTPSMVKYKCSEVDVYQDFSTTDLVRASQAQLHSSSNNTRRSSIALMSGRSLSSIDIRQEHEHEQFESNSDLCVVRESDEYNCAEQSSRHEVPDRTASCFGVSIGRMSDSDVGSRTKLASSSMSIGNAGTHKKTTLQSPLSMEDNRQRIGSYEGCSLGEDSSHEGVMVHCGTSNVDDWTSYGELEPLYCSTPACVTPSSERCKLSLTKMMTENTVMPPFGSLQQRSNDLVSSQDILSSPMSREVAGNLSLEDNDIQERAKRRLSYPEEQSSHIISQKSSSLVSKNPSQESSGMVTKDSFEEYLSPTSVMKQKQIDSVIMRMHSISQPSSLTCASTDGGESDTSGRRISDQASAQTNINMSFPRGSMGTKSSDIEPKTRKEDPKEDLTGYPGYGNIDYTTPSKLQTKIRDRNATEMSRNSPGYGNIDYTTPSMLESKIYDRKATANSQNSPRYGDIDYATPSTLASKIHFINKKGISESEILYNTQSATSSSKIKEDVYPFEAKSVRPSKVAVDALTLPSAAIVEQDSSHETVEYFTSSKLRADMQNDAAMAENSQFISYVKPDYITPTKPDGNAGDAIKRRDVMPHDISGTTRNPLEMTVTDHDEINTGYRRYSRRYSQPMNELNLLLGQIDHNAIEVGDRDKPKMQPEKTDIFHSSIVFPVNTINTAPEMVRENQQSVEAVKELQDRNSQVSSQLWKTSVGNMSNPGKMFLESDSSCETFEYFTAAQLKSTRTEMTEDNSQYISFERKEYMSELYPDDIVDISTKSKKLSIDMPDNEQHKDEKTVIDHEAINTGYRRYSRRYSQIVDENLLVRLSTTAPEECKGYDSNTVLPEVSNAYRFSKDHPMNAVINRVDIVSDDMRIDGRREERNDEVITETRAHDEEHVGNDEVITETRAHAEEHVEMFDSVMEGNAHYFYDAHVEIPPMDTDSGIITRDEIDVSQPENDMETSEHNYRNDHVAQSDITNYFMDQALPSKYESQTVSEPEFIQHFSNGNYVVHEQPSDSTDLHSYMVSSEAMQFSTSTDSEHAIRVHSLTSSEAGIDHMHTGHPGRDGYMCNGPFYSSDALVPSKGPESPLYAPWKTEKGSNGIPIIGPRIQHPHHSGSQQSPVSWTKNFGYDNSSSTSLGLVPDPCPAPSPSYDDRYSRIFSTLQGATNVLEATPPFDSASAFSANPLSASHPPVDVAPPSPLLSPVCAQHRNLVNTKDNQNVSVLAQNSTLMEENKILKEKYNRLSTRSSDLELRLGHIQDDMNRMQEQFVQDLTDMQLHKQDSVQKDVAELQRKTSMINTEKEVLKSELISLKQQLAMYRNQEQKLHQDLRKADTEKTSKLEMATLTSELSQIKEILGQSEAQVLSGEQRCQDLSQQIVTVTESKDLLEQQLLTGGGQAILEKQLRAIEERLRVTESRLHEERADRAGGLSVIEEKLLGLNAKLQITEKELSRKLQREKDSNQRQTQKIKDLHTENDQLRASDRSQTNAYDIPYSSHSNYRDTKQGLLNIVRESEDKIRKLDENLTDVIHEKSGLESTYSQQLSSLTFERHSLLAQLKSMEDKIAGLKAENEILSQPLEIPTDPIPVSELTAKESKIQTLSLDIHSMENKLLQAERTRQLLLTEMHGLRSHVAALEAKLSRDMSLDEQLAASRAVESESRKKQQKIDKLNAEMESRQSDLKLWQDKFNVLHIETSFLKDKLDTASRECGMLKKQQQEARNSAEQSTQQMKVLENLLEERDAQLLARTAEYHKVKVELDQASQELIQHHEKEHDMACQIQEHAALLEGSEETVALLSQLHVERKRLENRVTELQDSLATTSKGLTDATSKLEEYEQSLRSNEHELHEKRSLIITLEGSQEKTDLVVNQQTSKIKKLHDNLQTLSVANTALEKRLEMEKSWHAEEKLQAIQKNEGLVVQTERLELIKHEQSALLSSLQAEQRTTAQLREQIEHAEKEVLRLTDLLLTTRLDVESCRGQLMVNREANDQLRCDKAAVQKDYQDVCRRLADTECRLTTVQDECSHTVQSIQDDQESRRQTYDKEKCALEADAERTRDQVKHLEELLAQKDAQLRAFGRTLQDLDDKTRTSQKLESKKHQLEQSLGDTQILLESHRVETKKLQETNKDLQDTLSSLQMRHYNLQEEMKRHQDDSLRQATSLKNNMTEQQSSHEAEKYNLKERLSKAEQSWKSCEVTLSTTQTEKERLDEDAKVQDKSMDELKSKIHEETLTRRLAEQKLDSMQTHVEDYQQRKLYSEEKIIEVQSLLAKSEATLTTERDKMKHLKDELSEMEATSFVNERNSKAAQEQVELLQSEVLKLRQMMDGQKQQWTSKYKKSMSELRQTQEQLLNDKTKLLQQAQQLSVDLEQARENIVIKNKEIRKLQEEILSLEEKVCETANQLKQSVDSRKLETEVHNRFNVRYQEIEEDLRKLKSLLSEKKGNSQDENKTAWFETNRALQELRDQLSVSQKAKGINEQEARLIQSLRKQICELEAELMTEKALHAITANSLSNLEEDAERLRQQLRLLRQRESISPQKKEKSRREEINEIIARSQTRAQEMLASAAVQNDTFRHLSPVRDYSSYSSSPDVSPLADTLNYTLNTGHNGQQLFIPVMYPATLSPRGSHSVDPKTRKSMQY